MGVTGIWQWVVILLIVVILFGGRGKISAIMGDLGKGLRNFRSGMKDSKDSGGEDPDMIQAGTGSAAGQKKTAKKKRAAKKARAKA